MKIVEDPNVPEGYALPSNEEIAACACASEPLTTDCIQEATEEFMQEAGQLDNVGFFHYDHPTRVNRRRMLFGEQGEVNELFIADKEDDLVEYCDGLLDVMVVAWGNLLSVVGVDAALELAAEVNRSNLDKINGKHGPIVWDGEPRKSKVKKPVGWVGPDLRGILEKHGML